MRVRLRRLVSAGVLAVLLSACANDAATSSNPSPSEQPTPTQTAAGSVAPTPTPGAGGLTDEEIAAITLGALVEIPIDAPLPKVDAAAAEAIVRTAYTGERTTIDVRRIAMQLPSGIRIGWLVALTPMKGAPCALHPGLLPRAIEGGIVDDQTGDQFWSSTCG